MVEPGSIELGKIMAVPEELMSNLKKLVSVYDFSNVVLYTKVATLTAGT